MLKKYHFMPQALRRTFAHWSWFLSAMLSIKWYSFVQQVAYVFKWWGEKGGGIWRIPAAWITVIYEFASSGGRSVTHAHTQIKQMVAVWVPWTPLHFPLFFKTVSINTHRFAIAFVWWKRYKSAGNQGSCYKIRRGLIKLMDIWGVSWFSRIFRILDMNRKLSTTLFHQCFLSSLVQHISFKPVGGTKSLLSSSQKLRADPRLFV